MIEGRLLKTVLLGAVYRCLFVFSALLEVSGDKRVTFDMVDY